MRTLRYRAIEELNPVLVKKDRAYANGVLDVCNWINFEFAYTSSHPYALGDVFLCKFNYLKKHQLRKTPRPEK